MRVGLGYDIHPLVSGRKFVLGGVSLPGDKGPTGHSDGDCLFHAITDALLGASGLGDIGHYFPDTDPRWKGAPSSLFLKEARRLLRERALHIENIDANILLEKPSLRPYLTSMVENIAKLLGLGKERINIKAKRGEGLDAVGRREAVAAQVIVLISSSLTKWSFQGC
ncbi:MAG: 2-C-methyl-D-erythritol 2,4-cyclodiphosphate synthase [Deltaproteobacteria bacterium]|nr:2-C-methyl-D-erythritol 2,4-cyclodiphosphate synthase [Deltaproteobacteria bacterium]MBI4374387.1 2-C-methyl-D-erythritol 2,4-cyclodiphosphate synthase [Deltaproteobacteria bacterium]